MQDPAGYFDHFKLKSYKAADGREYMVRDILTRVSLFRNIKNDNLGLVDYTVQDGQRADHIAYAYYGDDRYTWLVYLVNDIIDPYHDWPLSNEELTSFITFKYGSVVNAQRKVHHWRINWPEDESTITQEQFDGLTPTQKHYWNGVRGYQDQFIYFERKHLDNIKNTNRVINIPINNPSNYEFEVGGTIRDNIVEGVTGEIEFIGYNYLTLKHVDGVWSSGTIFDVDKDTFTDVQYGAQTVLIDNLGGASPYWISVSNYQYELEQNEKKKHIKLLERGMLSLVTDNMRDLLQQ